ncbi:DUF6691 family protein [Novosphingobium sp.]|uniref:DUF6691 family protein n=1 Tax=Novosphingobium sp. TaxID=1874826 RepID=UPI0025D8D093|nr:DUF6691 family protein [Novosphingobium sp.]
MIRLLVALVAGSLFGAGLAYSGMGDPARVQGFLDITGNWDPTLAFVMGGAIIPMLVAWMIQRRMAKPLAGVTFSLPETKVIDRKLAAGAALFGTGWGIGGLCPGPALADLALSPLPAFAFVMAMFAGMIAHRLAL